MERQIIKLRQSLKASTGTQDRRKKVCPSARPRGENQTFSGKPIDTEEAALQMDLLGHDFLSL